MRDVVVEGRVCKSWFWRRIDTQCASNPKLMKSSSMLSSIFHVSRILRVAATCVSLAVTASGLVFAQGVREKIILEGTVRDAAGNPIAAAAVSFEGVTSETAPATRTDANGLFVLKLERADEYKIRVAN